MKFVLVAGASGYLGRYIISELKRQGYRVRALTRQRDKLWKRGERLAPAVGPEVDEIVSADLTQPHSLQGICRQIDFVISCAGGPLDSAEANFEQQDYFGNRNLLIEAINAGSVEKFVFISQLPSAKMPGAQSVLYKEKFVSDLQNSVMTSYVVRPAPLYPSLLPLLYMAQRGRIWLPGIGQQKLNPIHGADLARVCVRGLLAKEKELSVGGPRSLSFVEMSEIAFKASDKPPHIHAVPEALTGLSGGVLKVFKPKQHQDFLRLQSPRLLTPEVASQGQEKLLTYFQEYVKSPFFRP